MICIEQVHTDGFVEAAKADLNKKSFVFIRYDMFTKRPFGHRNKTIRQKCFVKTAAFGHLYLVVEPVSLGQGVDDLSDPSYLIHPISASGRD